jgi:4-amino-4-deoxy-L-arabinose transferase-like glycosyltransferase
MRGDWRDYRPAIWLTMLGVAMALAVNPPYFSAIFFGAAIGAAIRIRQRRRTTVDRRRRGSGGA